MFVAQLYLWHLKWERKFEVARLMKRPLPAFKDIDPPALLVQVPGFFGQNVSVQKTQSVRCGVGMP